MTTEVSDSDFAVHPLALDLNKALSQLDSGRPHCSTAPCVTLSPCECCTEQSEATDALGYPVGYFETTSGSFAASRLTVPPNFRRSLRGLVMSTVNLGSSKTKKFIPGNRSVTATVRLAGAGEHSFG